MIKFSQFLTKDENGTHLEILSDKLIKYAEYSSEIQNFIKTLDKDPKYLYLILNALGAGEYWSCNNNGDFFGEDELQSSYKTFMQAKVYQNHLNKNPDKSYGDVLFAYYNPRMHRVELVIRLSREKAPSLVERIENGEYPSVSMGTKVKYDVCSFCGQKNKSFKDYCEHLRYHMNEILPDGRKIFAINVHPRFFDISFVVHGADKTASVLTKIAGERKIVIPSAKLAFDYMIKHGIQDVDNPEKVKQNLTADELKKLAYYRNELIPRIEYYEPDIEIRDLDKLASYPIDNVLATSNVCGIVLKPREFQRIVLIQMGEKDLADDMDKENIVISTAKPSDIEEFEKEVDDFDTTMNFSPSIFDILEKYIPGRSVWEPHFSRKIIMIEKLPKKKLLTKTASSIPTGPDLKSLLSLLTMGYLIYRGKPLPTIEELKKLDPGALSRLMGYGLSGYFLATENKRREQEAQKNTDGVYKFGSLSSRVLWAVGPVAGAYLTSGYLEGKRERGEPRSDIQEIIRKHPGAVALGSLYLTRGKWGGKPRKSRGLFGRIK